MIMSEPARDEPRRVNMQARVASPVRTGSLLELAPLLELAVRNRTGASAPDSAPRAASTTRFLQHRPLDRPASTYRR